MPPAKSAAARGDMPNRRKSACMGRTPAESMERNDRNFTVVDTSGPPSRLKPRRTASSPPRNRNRPAANFATAATVS